MSSVRQIEQGRQKGEVIHFEFVEWVYHVGQLKKKLSCI